MGDGQNCNGKVVKEGSEAENHAQTVCRRCKEQYTASSNSPNSCRFHPSFFVCRRHDDQKRCGGQSWYNLDCRRLAKFLCRDCMRPLLDQFSPTKGCKQFINAVKVLRTGTRRSALCCQVL